MVKIAFHTEQLDVRGTCVALYDYAHYNEVILGNQSVIFTKLNKLDKTALSRFTRRFSVRAYETNEQMEQILKNEEFDMIYNIEYGNTNFCSRFVPTAIHCVFDCSKPHGTVYAAISTTLAKKYNHQLVVPHMISLKPDHSENLRDKLEIPDNAVVFGRYGGMDTFNLTWCHDVIKNLVNQRTDIYFIFINTPQFYIHRQIKYLPLITTHKEKNRFINTTDAHLECSTLGHSFGLAIGEFSVNNKPIIAYKGPVWNTAHFEILKEKGIYFSTPKEFYNVLNNFKRSNYPIDLNCYKDYSPKKVMAIFKKVFIDNCQKLNL